MQDVSTYFSPPEKPADPLVKAGTYPPRTGMTNAAEMTDGYPGRFITALENTMAKSDGQHEGALVILRVNNMPMILRAAGAPASEEVMQKIYDQVSTIIGVEDEVFRVQRDELGVILNHAGESEVDYLAGRMLSAIKDLTFNSNISAIHCFCSVATVCFPTQAKNVEEALSMAYLATHDHTISDQAIRKYDASEEIAAWHRQEMSLANYLHKAIEENRLLLAYQPIINSKDGSLAHVEALLRIRSDDGKISSAGALIPIAERMGLIDIIDERVLKMVVKELRRDPTTNIAFNISNLTTHNAQWMHLFCELMTETPEIAERLIVEITETAAHRDLQHTAVFVAEIQSFGCQVALDDFGSGYTSFRQLKTLSVDMVKIDGSFVKDLVDSADNRFFVKTLLDFTNAFGLRSVAEFVENGEIAKMLMELGVEMLQGYYFGMPEVKEDASHEAEGA
tara:strand:+ start:862 stop:2214 length:1353 start_codon:yes stop_codon:yes gene_type:complete